MISKKQGIEILNAGLATGGDFCEIYIEEKLAKSILIENNENIYVVIRDSNSWVIASYDKELTLKAKSSVIVLESTPVIITDTGMAVTTSDGTVVILDPDTLEKKW